MEFAERECRRHKNTPPDHRADPDQPDFDLQERLGVRGERRRILFRKGLLRPPFHQARLPRQPGTPQFVMLSVMATNAVTGGSVTSSAGNRSRQRDHVRSTGRAAISNGSLVKPRLVPSTIAGHAKGPATS